MKFLKKSIFALLAFLSIAAAILWALSKTIKPEAFKEYVSSQLTVLTDQQSRINGDISWQIFPRPAINIASVQIGDDNNQSFSIKLDNLRFNLKITPLFRGKLVFSELNINGFKININSDKEIAKNKKIEFKSRKKSNSITKQFAIEKILLTQGQINLHLNQKLISLSNLQIGAEQFNLNKTLFPFQFKSQLNIASSTDTLLKGQMNFKGSLSLSPSLFSEPLSEFTNLPLTGHLALQNVKLNQLKINKFKASVKSKAGLLTLNPLSLEMYEGESIGDLSYDFANSKLTLNQTASNLNAAQLISDLFKKKLLKGYIDFSLHSQTHLKNGNWPENTLGNGSLTIKDGLLESFNLNKIIDETSNKISHLLKGPKNDLKEILQLNQFNDPAFFEGGTAFQLLTFQYALQNAKLFSDSLVLQTDRLQLKGNGELNLKNKELNNHLYVTVSLTNPELNKIQQLLGGNFPLLVQGNLLAPLILPDLKVINPILTQFFLKETLKNPVKQIHNQIKNLLTSKQE